MKKLKNNISNLKSSIKEVFSNWKYVLLTLIIASLFVSFNLLVPNYKYILKNFRLDTILYFLMGGLNTITLASLISMIIISLLTGMLVSLVVYKIKIISLVNSKKTTGLGGAAVFLGALVPACSTCGFGLLALLGYGGLLVALPFAGLEIAWLSIIILVVALTVISGQIARKTCEIDNKKF